MHSPDDHPGILLWRASNSWQRSVRTVLKKQGITQSQYILLLGLYCLETRKEIKQSYITQQNLSEYCGCDAAMASQVLRQLEAKSLLRRLSVEDARSVSLTLTKEGAEVISVIEDNFVDVNKSFFFSLGENVEMFKAALQVLVIITPRMKSTKRLNKTIKLFSITRLICLLSFIVHLVNFLFLYCLNSFNFWNVMAQKILDNFV